MPDIQSPAPDLPAVLETEAQLDEFLTRPRPVLIESIRGIPSPLVIVGAGGKMGPTLAVLARNAARAVGHDLRVIAVSRFSNADAQRWLQERDVETINADLLERTAVDRLPEASHVIYLVGLKFGTQDNPSLTWAVNTIAPALVGERYAGARVVALSTGNVYPLVDITSGGVQENHSLTPFGEYANAAVARERVFEYCSRKFQTPMVLMRLNYAIDLRYGVLLDLARKVHAGEPVDLSMGYFNCVWQGDANEMILRAFPLASCPPRALNLTGTSILSVRDVATRLGECLGRAPRFVGIESTTALLSQVTPMRAAFGDPPVAADAMIRWVAHWVSQGGRTLGKPTGFQVRDGKF